MPRQKIPYSSRTFDGKKYKFHIARREQDRGKTICKKEAQRLRKRGDLARVIRTTKYRIWIVMRYRRRGRKRR